MATAEKTKDYAVERFLFFSDAVFAIAVTLLALDLKLPESLSLTSDHAVLQALGNNIDKFIGFIISFVVIASFWAWHVHCFRKLNTFERPFVWINTLMLLPIALVPFTTSLISGASGRVPVIIYAANIAFIGLVAAFMWRYAVRHKYIGDNVSDAQRINGQRSMFLLSGVFLLSIPVAFVSPQIASYFWLLLIPVMRFAK